MDTDSVISNAGFDVIANPHAKLSDIQLQAIQRRKEHKQMKLHKGL